MGIKHLIVYCQFRGRGRNSRIFYLIVTIIALTLIYTYPRHNNFHPDDYKYQVEDLKEKAELFVDNAVKAKDFEVSRIHSSPMDDDGDDDKHDNDDEGNEEEGKEDEEEEEDEEDEDEEDMDEDYEEEDANIIEAHAKWNKDAAAARFKEFIQEDAKNDQASKQKDNVIKDDVLVPDIDDDIKDNDDKVDHPDVEDRQDLQQGIVVPRVDNELNIMKKHNDAVEPLDAVDGMQGDIKEEGVHNDALEAPDAEDHINGQEPAVHDDILEPPDAADHIKVRDDVELPEVDIKDHPQDNLEAPDPHDQNEAHNDDLDLPNVDDHQLDKEEVMDGNDNLEAPEVIEVVEKPDNLAPPEKDVEEHGDDLKPPDVELAELHADDIPLPDVDDDIKEVPEKDNDDNVEIPKVVEEKRMDDNLKLPDKLVIPKDNVKAPNTDLREGHPDDVPLPPVDDLHGVKDVEGAQVNERENDNLGPPEEPQIPEDNLKAPDTNVKEGYPDDVPLPLVDDLHVAQDVTEFQVEQNKKVDPELKDNQNVAKNNIKAENTNLAGHPDDVPLPPVDDLHGVQDVEAAQILDNLPKEELDRDKRNAAAPDPTKQDAFVAKDIKGFPLEPCTGERTNFVYMKMIKSASETMVSMLRRFGYFRDLNYVQPIGKRIYVGWPYQIDEGYYRANKRPGKEFNILCEHAVYNKTILQKLMPANTVYFTSLREPYQQVKSMFSYYKLAKALKLEHLQDPFTEYIRNIDKYEKIYQVSETRHFRQCIPDNFSMTYNLMSFILGYPTGALGLTPDKTQDDAFIDKWLQDIDNSFSLVMIVDYFDESLVLLKRLMCWTWKDILHYNSNVLRYPWKENVDPEHIRIYKERSRVDYKLYNYFNQTFWRRVENEKHDFWGEVREYKKTASEMYDYCQNSPPNLIYNVQDNKWTKGFSINKQDCYDMVHYYDIFLKIKERYDNSPVEVHQPPMKINIC